MSTNAKWSYKAGEKGRNRVRAYTKGSGIFLEFYERDPETGEQRRARVSTGHADRDKAKAQADRLAADFAEAPPEPTPGLTLRELFDNYMDKRTPQVGERQQKHHRRVAELFCRYFGWRREAESLNRKDWDRFIGDRSAGVIDGRGNRVPGAQEVVSARTVKRDLQALRTVLNWAVEADLLDHNPCARYPFPKVHNQHRPRISQERYKEMLKIAGDIDWRFELALILAHETGHRIRAIRHLRWSDVDLAEGLMRWRAEQDKMGVEHFTPLTERAVEALRKVRGDRAVIGDSWVFPAPKDDAKPVSRHLVRKWWYRAEDLAGLEHIDGLGWHGFRRKFADELRDVPLKDLADLGGWKTPRTILEVYQGSNLDSMRQAQQQRRSLRSEAAGSR